MMTRNGPRQKGAFDADEAELACVRGGHGSVYAGAHDEILTGEIDDPDPGNSEKLPAWMRREKLPAWMRRDVAAEDITGTALEVIEARRKLLRDSYPFEIDRSALRYVASGDGFYEYCLATSLSAQNNTLKHQKLVRHFERIACDLLVAFIGGDAKGVRIGWPSEKDWDDMPRRMERKIAWMKEALRFDNDEWTLDRAGRIDAIRNNAKDARIDLVVRRSHGDERIGGLTLLGQCGCGRNDVDSSSRKHEELDGKWIKHFFGRASIPRPITAFATAQHIVNTGDLYAKQSAGNVMIFDRVRLCLLARDNPEVIRKHSGKIKELTVSVL